MLLKSRKNIAKKNVMKLFATGPCHECQLELSAALSGGGGPARGRVPRHPRDHTLRKPHSESCEGPARLETEH